MDEDFEDEEDDVIGLFENGYWIWDENVQELVFQSNFQQQETDQTFKMSTKTNISALQFRDDIDFLEQIRYRRYYQRKVQTDEPDVITVQDIKDLVLFTAPLTILSPMLINFLHTSSIERMIRALIFYMQYYSQVADKMVIRNAALKSQIRTIGSKNIEAQLRDDLSDLRLLVLKEWALMLVGGDDYRRYHHMSDAKKGRSLSEMDSKLYETMLQMFIRIVWLALGRNSFNRIELELNRLFRNEVFNSAEHNLKTRYIEKMTKIERNVLLGACDKRIKGKAKLCTPMINELVCERKVDYRMLGLGTIRFPELTPRLLHMQIAINAPEEQLVELKVSVGILGLPRAKFDTMLRPIPTGSMSSSTSFKSRSHHSFILKMTSKPTVAKSKSKCGVKPKLFPDIVLPPKEDYPIPYPEEFPREGFPRRLCSDVQRQKWLNRLMKRLQKLNKVKSGLTFNSIV